MAAATTPDAVPAETEVINLFFDGARSVAAALGSAQVGEAWDRSSVLEDQLVSGLCGHLARGGVWVVAEYLKGDPPAGPVDFETATAYLAAFAAVAPELHRGSRDLSAEIGAAGQVAVGDRLAEHIRAMQATLMGADPGRLVAVIAGRVMRLSDYLDTRLVEQAVHLDDLARSVGAGSFPYPDAARDRVIAIGLALAAERTGRSGLLRALYRGGFANDAFPVI